MPSSNTLRNGAVAGLLAAAAVAVFFLAVDTFVGQPFRTPALLARVVAGRPADAEVGSGMLAVYTLLHLGVFALVGIAVGLMLERTGTRPMPLLGLILGLLLFDLVFYLGVVLRGVDIVEALGWPALLAGNLLAGLVLLGWLYAVRPQDGRSWRDVLRRYTTLREGLVAGLIGALAVAAWFLVVDVATREPFFTPAALGSAVLHGARGVDAVVIDAVTVLGYSVLHFGAFLFVGLIAAALAAEAERHGVVLLGAVMLFVAFETLFLGLTAIAATWLLDALSAWNIVAANVIAALAMGRYLWHAHPRLAEHLTGDLEEDHFRHGRPTAAPPAATPGTRSPPRDG